MEKMIHVKDLIEHQIGQKVKGENTLPWHDNQMGIRDLYTITGEKFAWDQNYQYVSDFVKDDE